MTRKPDARELLFTGCSDSGPVMEAVEAVERLVFAMVNDVRLAASKNGRVGVTVLGESDVETVQGLVRTSRYDEARPLARLSTPRSAIAGILSGASAVVPPAILIACEDHDMWVPGVMRAWAKFEFFHQLEIQAGTDAEPTGDAVDVVGAGPLVEARHIIVPVQLVDAQRAYGPKSSLGRNLQGIISGDIGVRSIEVRDMIGSRAILGGGLPLERTDDYRALSGVLALFAANADGRDRFTRAELEHVPADMFYRACGVNDNSVNRKRLVATLARQNRKKVFLAWKDEQGVWDASDEALMIVRPRWDTHDGAEQLLHFHRGDVGTLWHLDLPVDYSIRLSPGLLILRQRIVFDQDIWANIADACGKVRGHRRILNGDAFMLWELAQTAHTTNAKMRVAYLERSNLLRRQHTDETVRGYAKRSKLRELDDKHAEHLEILRQAGVVKGFKLGERHDMADPDAIIRDTVELTGRLIRR